MANRFLALLFVPVLLLVACAGQHHVAPGGRHSQGVLRFGVQTANFMSQAEKTGLWVIVDVPHRSLQFERKAKHFAANFEVTLALRDEQNHAVELIDASRSLEVNTFDSTQPDSLYVRVSNFLPATPGTYKLEAVVIDRVSKGRGFYSTEVEVRDLLSPQLTLSDILLLEETPDGAPTDDLVVPAYRQRFNKTVYALAQARHVGAGQRLKATLRITNRETPGANSAVLDTLASSETVNLIFPIPPGQLGLGSQQLELEVASNSHVAKVERDVLVRWASRPTSSQGLRDYIAPMRLIMTGREWKELENAPPEEKTQLIAKFWKERNPSSDSKANLLEEEFYWRVGEANSRFSWSRREGWETDRGRIYVIHGPPANVNRQYDRFGRNFEIWTYEDPVREFVFFDEHGDGRFLLVRQSYTG